MSRNYSLVLLLTLAGCYNMPGGDITADADGANSVNGSIHVPAGTHSKNVSTVNGSIHVDDNAAIGTGDTVNGSIALGAHATADELTTVNGSITLGDGDHVARNITTVNGGMKLGNGAEVGGAAANVNGHIALTAAHVAGGLRTVSGDIDVLGGSHVEGGILVKHGGNGWFNFDTHKPRIVIGPGAVVTGDLHFEREVDLFVSDQATIGTVTGAKAVRFTGPTPPS